MVENVLGAYYDISNALSSGEQKIEYTDEAHSKYLGNLYKSGLEFKSPQMLAKEYADKTNQDAENASFREALEIFRQNVPEYTDKAKQYFDALKDAMGDDAKRITMSYDATFSRKDNKNVAEFMATIAPL